MIGTYNTGDLLAKFVSDVFENEETVESFAARVVDNARTVDVNWENMSFFNEESLGETAFSAGWRTAKGSPIYLGYVHGDWEWPVYIVFYLNEDGELRAYYPMKGNTFNLDTKKAVGNDRGADMTFLTKHLPPWFPKREFTMEDVEGEPEDVVPDVDLMISDFLAHFLA